MISGSMDGEVLEWGCLKDVDCRYNQVLAIDAGEHLRSNARAGWTDAEGRLVRSVAVGFTHLAAIRSDGSLMLRPGGANWFVPTDLGPASSVVAGDRLTAVLQGDGVARVFDHAGMRTDIEAALSHPSGIVALACHGRHVVALTADATVVAGGDNSVGQVDVPVGLVGVVKVTCDDVGSMALRNDGSVVIWGEHESGRWIVPPWIPALADIGLSSGSAFGVDADGVVWRWWIGARRTMMPVGIDSAVQVANGYYHGLWLDEAGLVHGWGENDSGEATPPPDLGVVVGVAAGQGWSMALRGNGTVRCWGLNNQGQSDVPSDLASVVQVAASENTAFALLTDGTVTAWGSDDYGLASGCTTLWGVEEIAVSRWHGLARRQDGTVFGWGSNASGQIDVPMGLTGVVAISAGDGRSLALTDDGTPVQWPSDTAYGIEGVPALAAVGFVGWISVGVDPLGGIHGWGAQEGSPLQLAELRATVAAGNGQAMSLETAGYAGAVFVLGGDWCVIDLDGDGMVGGAELAAVLGAWGTDGGPLGADFDGSGLVDGADLLIVLSQYGECGA